MTPQQANELLPCLHCDCHAVSIWTSPECATRHRIKCEDCPACVDCYSSTREQAIAAWNRRAPAPTEPAVDRGLEAAAALVERKAAAYDAECGNTDPETGTREYPGDGAEWVMEMEELAEEIRALATPASQAVPGDPRVNDLAMLTRQLVRALSKAVPGHDLPAKALDYLKRKGLQGSPLRDAAPAPLAPRKLLRYGDCRCILSQYCDGTCNPIFGDPAPQLPQASQPTSAEG